jgi:hypothetical protein
VASCCERGDEPRDSVKCGEFREALRDCQLFKNDSASWSLFGRTNMLTAGNNYACHVVFHTGLSCASELN